MIAPALEQVLMNFKGYCVLLPCLAEKRKKSFLIYTTALCCAQFWWGVLESQLRLVESAETWLLPADIKGCMASSEYCKYTLQNMQPNGMGRNLAQTL